MATPYTPTYRRRKEDEQGLGNYRDSAAMMDDSLDALSAAYSERQQQKKQASDFLDAVKNPISSVSTSYGTATPEVPNGTGTKNLVSDSPIIKQDPAPGQGEPIDWRANLAEQYEKLNKRYEELEAEDEAARKSEGARRRIGAIADAISGVANMWGVSRGAYNQDNAKAYSLINENIVKDRNMRVAELGRINARLDNTLRQMRLAEVDDRDRIIREMNANTRAQNANTNAGNLAYKNDRLASDAEKTKANNDAKIKVAEIGAESRENVARINSGTRITTTGMNNQTSIIVANIRKSGGSTPAAKILNSSDWNSTRDSLFEAAYGTSNRDELPAEGKREYDELKKTKGSVENFLDNHPDVGEAIGGGSPQAQQDHKKNAFGDSQTSNQQKNHKKNAFD